jgi:hypothetical protein
MRKAAKVSGEARVRSTDTICIKACCDAAAQPRKSSHYHQRRVGLGWSQYETTSGSRLLRVRTFHFGFARPESWPVVQDWAG